jgi:tetratricopeptide (TPR) repeat protein
MARLDRMAPVKEVAQVGAAIGREFSSRLLAPVLDMNEATLGAALTQLVDAGLLVSRGGDIYAFRHALTRDAAYASLLRSRRQICHQRIATALEEFDDGFVRASEPELLAFHYQEAGDFSAAFAHWIAAGDVAEQRGASAEAIAHYQSAKALTENADLSAADRARAAEVLLKLGNAQWQTAGYQAEEVMRSYREARDAALALDQQDEAAEADIRKATFLFGSCRNRDVLELGHNILRRDPHRLRPETLVHLWVMVSSAHCHLGNFEQSLAFSERAIELDDQVSCGHRAPCSGADPAIVARDTAEMALRPLGHLDRSLAVSERGMAIALERGHLFSIVWASVARILALTSFGRYAEAVSCADNAQSREQVARLFELNAVRDLARLAAEAGDVTEALGTLRAIVDWFPATLDVPALAECRALLQ